MTTRSIKRYIMIAVFSQPNHVEMLSNLLKCCFIMTDPHSVSTNMNIKLFYHQSLCHFEQCFASFPCVGCVDVTNESMLKMDSKLQLIPFFTDLACNFIQLCSGGQTISPVKSSLLDLQ